jgi:hypothetical protein
MASKENQKPRNTESPEKEDMGYKVADEGVISNRNSRKNDKNALPNPKDINVQDIPEYIEILENHRKLCEKNANYVEAEMAKNRVAELKRQYEAYRKEDVRSKHAGEKQQIEEAHLAEFNQFNDFWDKKMMEFNEQAQQIEEQMLNKHHQELTKFLEELDTNLPVKPKDSVELLNLRKIQENLARQKEYIEAHKIQQKCTSLEREENDRWIQLRDLKIKNQRQQLEMRQSNEITALRKRIATGQDEQRKARSIELERLLQKYQNVKKELDTQQSHEVLKIGKQSKGSQASLYRSGSGSQYVNNRATPRADSKNGMNSSAAFLRKSGQGFGGKQFAANNK